MARKKDTLLFDTPPVVAAWAAAGGKKESEGPLASDFDFLTQDAGFCEQGCENWEQAESLLQRRAAELCLRKADLPRTGVDIAFAGDLQAQCTASNYTMRELGIPFAGVYGACSTMAETLALAAVFAAGGMAERALALTSSHFCAAVPHAAGIRCQAHPHRSVDRHRCRGLSGAGARHRRAGAQRDLRPGAGLCSA